MSVGFSINRDFGVGVPGMIARECIEICDLLLLKNQKYGNAAFEPRRIFSKASNIEQILVRIDDKLARIETTGLSGADEDTVKDLIGYLILLRVVQQWQAEKMESE